MNIAFISYEFPTETGGGGIGTYLYNIVPALRKLGHFSIVICGTKLNETFWEQDFIYRISCSGPNRFNDNLVNHFSKLHSSYKFDLIEGTDFKGWGYTIKEKFPEITYIVKLHTPSYLIDKLQFRPLSGIKKIRFILACLLNGKNPKIISNININDYQHEVKALALADRIVSPTHSISKELREIGLIRSDKKIDHVPLFIKIESTIFDINSRKDLINPQIVFIGRHEIRKGVIELADAIPLVLRKYPTSHFTFVGAASFSPNSNLDMIEYLKLRLSKYKNNVTFTNQIPAEKIHVYLDLGDIFVFPSHYESFGIVCTEAMAAGKSVIGSKNGGMVEILDNGTCGLLTNANKSEISKNILKLINDNHLRLSLGAKARQRIKSFYDSKNILALQVSSYEDAISSNKLKDIAILGKSC